VEPVRQLDHQDPDVPGHGDQHLAEVLGLALLAASERELADFGHAVDQLGDVRAEALAEHLLGRRRVLQDVVQEPGRHRRDVHLEVDEEPGHRQGVDVVGFPRHPSLAAVDLLGEGIGAADEVQVGPRLVARNLA